MFAINLILSELEKAILLHGYLHEFWYITPNRKNIKILIHFHKQFFRHSGLKKIQMIMISEQFLLSLPLGF